MSGTPVRSKIVTITEGSKLEICCNSQIKVIPFLSVFAYARRYSDRWVIRRLVLNMRPDGSRVMVCEHNAFCLTGTGGWAHRLLRWCGCGPLDAVFIVIR